MWDSVTTSLTVMGFAAVIANEADGGRHVPIFNGQDVGRAAGDDPKGLDQDALRLSDAASHHSVEQFGGLIARSFQVENNTRQRRIGEFAEQPVFIDAQHGDVVRHAKPGL